MTTLSTHVLDSSAGTPAAGVEVVLDAGSGAASTDQDGRLRFDGEVAEGQHTLVFRTGDYWGERPHFHPEVTVAFRVGADEPHVHVALLLGPFSYTTYRGS
jgi:5-hydroxyisourate hydrolase